MNTYDVYLHGMILKTNSFLLKDKYPIADTYGEIREKYELPGGETGTCATVLNSLGCTVKMDGNYMGAKTYPLIKSFYKDKKVDISALTVEEGYDGLEDYVIIDQATRTPFGMFQGFYGDTIERWNQPNREDIKAAAVVGLDPFFRIASEEVAAYCIEEGKKYVTIDCPYDSFLHQNASMTVISGEFFGYTYPDEDKEELFERYVENSEGLVIFTRGSKPLWYGRKATGRLSLEPYQVEVKSTLGAGDTFKAACIYALLKGMSDLETVKFASATAAVACTRFPLPLNPPQLEEVIALMNS